MSQLFATNPRTLQPDEPIFPAWDKPEKLQLPAVDFANGTLTAIVVPEGMSSTPLDQVADLSSSHSFVVAAPVIDDDGNMRLSKMLECPVCASPLRLIW